MDERVFDAMKPYMLEKFGNPSSLDHAYGAEASSAVEEARGKVAKCIGAPASDIIFTSGATESDNLALIGVMERYADRGDHLVTCTTEHKAVLDVAKHLEANGKRVTYLPVNEVGEISPEDLKDAITDKTVMVSIMLANNEVGTIADVKKIGEIVHDKGAIFHTDAAQAVGHMHVDVDDMNIDLMSFSAHKMYGPKGIGALYVRGIKPRVRLDPIIRGGGHERNRRSGTLNVPAIVGFGRAAEISAWEMDGEESRSRKWSKRMIDEFTSAGALLNGPLDNRLARNVNVCFPGVESKAVINKVSDKVAISAGSACTTETVEPSHVLLALGLDEERAHQSIRIGTGRHNNDEEISTAIDSIILATNELRRIIGK
ncbi:MAG: cysteine desulfurase [Alphaproteobacteria bacterium]|nr:cysteine desulfurase [Alphaproteobacteria bacterium]